MPGLTVKEAPVSTVTFLIVKFELIIGNGVA